MDESIVRLRTHRKNIERYESLIKTDLTLDEMTYVEKRLSEERSQIALLVRRTRSVNAALPS